MSILDKINPKNWFKKSEATISEAQDQPLDFSDTFNTYDYSKKLYDELNEAGYHDRYDADMWFEEHILQQFYDVPVEDDEDNEEPYKPKTVGDLINRPR